MGAQALITGQSKILLRDLKYCLTEIDRLNRCLRQPVEQCAGQSTAAGSQQRDIRRWCRGVGLHQHGYHGTGIFVL